jgi:GrpB-like predicted nucleotidyltransferase (UPF0157 family)
MADEVVVVAYDPSWPAKFAAAKERVSALLGTRALAIEHIGSTSVPGLSAKPVIDLLVGTASLAIADECVPLLVDDGWDFPADVNATIVDRRFLRKLEQNVRTHHLHLVVHRNDLWEGYLHFRDKLRRHDELAREYEALKRTLAEKYRDQRERYTSSKTEFVARVLGLPPDSVRTR